MKETKYWFWHMCTGLIILVLLSVHMITVHLSSLLGWFNPAGGPATDWANLMARARLFIYGATYILLLAAALFHGLYGLRTILLESGLMGGRQKFMNLLFLISGICLFALGSWAAAKFYLIAQGA